MTKFTEAIKAVKGGCELIVGRGKLTTDEVIAQYPNGITIDGFDFLTNADGEQFAVFTFAERKDSYFNGGKIATKVAYAWEDAFYGDVKKANIELAACGGCKIKMYKKQTKNGRTVTMFDEID